MAEFTVRQMVETAAEASADPDGVVWVDAVPFRAHLAHIMAVGRMSVAEVAAMTGVPVGAARRLLFGHGGRPVRRISADTARRLLRVTSWDARTVRRRSVSARGTVHQLRQILAAGLPLAEAAARSGVSGDVLLELLQRRRDTCSPLVAARVAAVQNAVGIGEDSGCPLAS